MIDWNLVNAVVFGVTVGTIVAFPYVAWYKSVKMGKYLKERYNEMNRRYIHERNENVELNGRLVMLERGQTSESRARHRRFSPYVEMPDVEQEFWEVPASAFSPSTSVARTVSPTSISFDYAEMERRIASMYGDGYNVVTSGIPAKKKEIKPILDPGFWK
jgi:hypothetical protein